MPELRKIAAIGLDQGSSSTKLVAIDAFGETLFRLSDPVETRFGAGGEIEQDPQELLSSVESLLGEAKRKLQEENFSLAAIGLAVQRSGVCAWSDENRALHPLITWRDNRGDIVIKPLGKKAALITKKTTLRPVGGYAGGKFSLLQKEYPGAFVGTLDTYLLYHLCRERPFVTDDTLAARSQLYDLEHGAWSDELCGLLATQKSRLPEIKPSLGLFGHWEGVPIMASLGDQQAALLARMRASQRFALNLGTLGSFCYASGETLQRLSGYVSSVHYSKMNEVSETQRFFVIEGVINACGAVFRYIQERWPEHSTREELEGFFSEIEPAVVFAPLLGTATPDWAFELPSLVAKGGGTGSKELVLGLLENIAFFTAAAMKGLLESFVSDLGTLRPIPVAGGVSELDGLLQAISDAAGVQLARVPEREATGVGAACASLRAQGLLEGETQAEPEYEQLFSPQKNTERLERFTLWSALRKSCVSGKIPESVEEL